VNFRKPVIFRKDVKVPIERASKVTEVPLPTTTGREHAMSMRRGLTTITVLLALTGLLATHAVARDDKTDGRGSGFYLSLGTSLSVGIQPNRAGQNRRTKEGYPDQLYAALSETRPKLRHVMLGCSGETTVTMIVGGICDYAEGSQLAEAVRFLRDHQGSVALVTIDMGANDIEPCGALSGAAQQLCVITALGNVSANLPTILGALRAAAGPSVLIVAMNYYNPFLAAWFQDPALARASDVLLRALNGVLEVIYTNLFGVPVADVAGAFLSSDFSPVPEAGGIPTNVLMICQLTWMCAPPPVGPNIHANADGYLVIAEAFLPLVH
jgi:lysophospholipase L1-like esterase